MGDAQHPGNFTQAISVAVFQQNNLPLQCGQFQDTLRKRIVAIILDIDASGLIIKRNNGVPLSLSQYVNRFVLNYRNDVALRFRTHRSGNFRNIFRYAHKRVVYRILRILCVV